MANDDFDNARTDKDMIARINAESRERILRSPVFVAQRKKRLADDPRVSCRTGAICPECKGSGLDAKLTTFEWDEFNPSGYWHTEPCEECGGSGLSQGMNNAMEQLGVQGQELAEARKLLGKLTEQLSEIHGRWNELAEYGSSCEYAEEIKELIDLLAPEGV